MPLAQLAPPALFKDVLLRQDSMPRLGILNAVLQSPSLEPVKRNGAAAYEFKFLLSESVAREVEARLSPHMSVDPHVDASGTGYDIATLYCDTQALDVFHRRGRHKLSKFRLRRYGDADKIYLERKSKRGERVRKRRSTLELGQLGVLASGDGALDEDQTWYRRQLMRHRVRPVCLIEYRRSAFIAPGSEGPLRLTFDRSISGSLHSDWSLERCGVALPLLADRVVCEFKFRGAMPLLFKSVVQEMQLVPGGVSKYRHCIEASGLAAAAGNSH